MPFDDDDNPALQLSVPGNNPGNDAGHADDDAMDDEVPDYKLFLSMFEKRGVSSQTIRKGEKDFESHGTEAQDTVLETSRQALEGVLNYSRIHREDAWVRAWYFPDYWLSLPADQRPTDVDGLFLDQRVVVVEHERGSWMKDIGRSVPGDKSQTGVGKLWLLPEEALHLVERGTLDLWWPEMSLAELIPAVGPPAVQDMSPDNYDIGVPLPLEAAYSLLIGEDGEHGKVSLAKYQVFTNLKRAGFHIMRDMVTSPPANDENKPSITLWQWLMSFIPAYQRQGPRNSCGPLIAPGLYRAYRPIYEQMALLPRHKPTANPPTVLRECEDPFKVHYLLWKASGAPFSKRSPPAPDFRIAVTDTTTAGLPTLEEIDTLLRSTPHCPPPASMTGNPGRMYQRLKHGHRNVLVAIVDRGLVNYMRFAEGAFGEETVYERYDSKRGGRGGKRGGGRGRGRGRGRGGRR